MPATPHTSSLLLQQNLIPLNSNAVDVPLSVVLLVMLSARQWMHNGMSGLEPLNQCLKSLNMVWLHRLLGNDRILK